MSEGKILEGPWEFMVGDYVRQESTGIVICEIRKRGIPESKAHGNLIAAAPELLEALTKLLGNAIQLNDAGDGWTEITADTQDVQQARAAIAKAIGS